MGWHFDLTLWHQGPGQRVPSRFTQDVYLTGYGAGFDDAALAAILMLVRLRHGVCWTPSRARSALRLCMAHREQDWNTLNARQTPEPMPVNRDRFAWIKPRDNPTLQDVYMCLRRCLPDRRSSLVDRQRLRSNMVKAWVHRMMFRYLEADPVICEVAWSGGTGQGSPHMVLCLGKPWPAARKLLFLDPVFGVVMSPYLANDPLTYAPVHNSCNVRTTRVGRIEQVILPDPSETNWDRLADAGYVENHLNFHG